MFIRNTMKGLLVLVVLSMAFSACSRQGSNEPTSTIPAEALSTVASTESPVVPVGRESEESTPISLAKILGNLSYSGIFPDHQIKLTDSYGYYEEEGSGSPYVRLIDHLIPTGDLNGDGTRDAVALLVDYTTGSGDFVYLAPVLNVEEEPTPMEATLIGDRIPVKSLAIQSAQVIADVIAPDTSDAACCPSLNTHKVFMLENGRLVESSSEDLSRVSVGDLNGTSWQLIDFDYDQEPVLPDTEITLQFDEGQISGFAGCNNYSSEVTRDENLPQTFVVGSMAVTSKICPEPTATQETTYLSRLADVVAWRYDFGHLALTYKLAEDQFGELEFALSAP